MGTCVDLGHLRPVVGRLGEARGAGQGWSKTGGLTWKVVDVEEEGDGNS